MTKLINVKKVKALIAEYQKQCSHEFIEQLDYVVRTRVIKAIQNAKQFKRLKASELL